MARSAALKQNTVSKKNPMELLVASSCALVASYLSLRFNIFDALYDFTREYEDWQLDEIFSVLLCSGLFFGALVIRRTVQLRREIAQRIAAEQTAHSLARHDALTGLPNRRVFADEVGRALTRVDRAKGACAVLLIDLDRFKQVNDLSGHAAGDAVLCEVAQRLRQEVRQGEIVARLGGDEFAAVIEFDAGSDAPLRVADRIIASISQPICVDEGVFEVGASIGVALFPTDGRDVDDLLRAADLAMYRAKHEGRGTVRYYEESMDVELRSRLALVEELRKAIRKGELRPHYHPLICLEDGRLLGFEILARWYHPERGVLLPGSFIPIAEEARLITDLSFAILRQACEAAKGWPQHLVLSLNISPSQLKDSSLPGSLLAILAETDFSPERLEVEITENALIGDLELARNFIEQLHKYGVRIALDDFGTGYSGLYHLRELKFDIIKIDRSFVQALRNPEHVKIIKGIISLGQSLGLYTTAEGIENVEQLMRLEKLGCDIGQGYHFAKPMSADDVNGFLSSERAMCDVGSLPSKCIARRSAPLTGSTANAD